MNPTETALRTRAGIEPNEPWPAYAWPGGYPLAYITTDGATLCAWCLNDPEMPTHHDPQWSDGWGVVALDIIEEAPDGPEQCEHCGRTIYEENAS